MALKYLGADEPAPKLAPPRQLKENKSMSGTKRTTVMTKRNMTICSDASNDIKVFGESSFINIDKFEHI